VALVDGEALGEADGVGVAVRNSFTEAAKPSGPEMSA
jgi:hypothetical protein